MSIRTWKFRSEKYAGALIDCPKHKIQRTLTLYDKRGIGGVGCEVCFEDLPIKNEKVR